jgi:hypothetical protein
MSKSRYSSSIDTLAGLASAGCLGVIFLFILTILGTASFLYSKLR